MNLSRVVAVRSSAVAVAGGSAALWSVLRLHGVWPTVGASLVTAAAVGGMHYAGMAAMRMTGQPMATAAAGATAEGFLLPAVVVIATLMFLIAFAVALAPTEHEIREDAALQARITEIERQSRERVTALQRTGLHTMPETGRARSPLRTSAGGAGTGDPVSLSTSSRRGRHSARTGRSVPEWVLQPTATTLIHSRG